MFYFEGMTLRYYENGVLRAENGSYRGHRRLKDKYTHVLVGGPADGSPFVSQNLQVYDLTMWNNTITQAQAAWHMKSRECHSLFNTGQFIVVVVVIIIITIIIKNRVSCVFRSPTDFYILSYVLDTFRSIQKNIPNNAFS